KSMLQDKPGLGTLMEDKPVENETMKDEYVKIICMKTKHVEGEAFEPLEDKSKEDERVEVKLVKDKSVEGGDVEVELVDIEGEVSEAVEGENMEGDNMENKTREINKGSISLESNSEINIPVLGLELEGFDLTKYYINQPIELSVGTRFNSWAIAEHYLKKYGRQKGFVINRYRVEYHKSHLTLLNDSVKKRTYVCENAGKYKPNKTKPIEQQPFRKFDESIINEIECVVVYGHCDAYTIRNLLQPLFPGRLFLTRDLSNAIQKIKCEKNVVGSDALHLLKFLLEQQKEDPTMFIQPLINTDSNRLSKPINTIFFYLYSFLLIMMVLQQTLDATGSEPWVIMTDMDLAIDMACQVKYINSYHVHCIWHMSQNLPKRLKTKLGSENFKEFICDFWKAWNSLSIEVFDRIFTAGMQSISRVESINAIIHKAVASSSSMSDVVEALELPAFSIVNNVIRKYFIPRIAKEINKQMCESVLYKCEKLDIDHALEDQLYSDENKLINNYGHLMGHFKKALSYSIENNDQNALDELILDYIAKKEKIRNVQTQLVSVEESQAYDDIKDPVVRKGKGRHPNKRLKAFNEETNKISSNKKQQDTADSDSKTRRRCRLCHKLGHYAPKCPNKENAI
ncbi:12795_t:CDS:2, partial [Racocetra persica]